MVLRQSLYAKLWMMNNNKIIYLNRLINYERIEKFILTIYCDVP